MKRLLLIICLCPILAFGQFSGAKKLLLQQGVVECQYNLSSYVAYSYFNYDYQSSVCSIPLTTINSLTSARQALDAIRSCGSTNCTRGFHLGFFISLNVGNTILSGSFEDVIHPICELLPVGDFWGFVTVSNFTVGQVPIVHIENGVITYKELY